MIRINPKIAVDAEFPFDIYEAHGQPPAPETTAVIHRHDCLEINYVVSGEGYYLFENQKYILHPGDVFVISSKYYHMCFSTANLKLKVLVFKADLVWNGNSLDYLYLKPFFEQGDQIAPFLPAHLPISRTAAGLIQNLHQEWTQKHPGYQLLIKADLLRLLGLIYRHYEEIESFDPHGIHSWKNYHSIVRAVDYINTHYQEHLSLKEMAELVYLSEQHFSSLFNKVMGIPFSKYVLEKRIHQACILLKTTDKPVTQVATDVGFDSLSYFNRVFKRDKKLSPSQYRDLQKTV